MDVSARLPAGYRARAATLDDAGRVADLLNAAAIADRGAAITERDDVRSDWQTPHVNLNADTLVVLPEDAGHDRPAVAFAIFWNSPPHTRTFLSVDVHPAYRGRGLGAALLDWGVARARAASQLAPAGARVVLREFILSSKPDAQELLASRGFERTGYNFRMGIELADRPAPPRLPQGVRIRSFVRGQDEENFIRANEEGFAESPEHVTRRMEDILAEWQIYMDTSPYFDPGLFLLAEREDEGCADPVIGVCRAMPQPAEGPDLGWIYGLTVLRSWRRRGIAEALLLREFQALYDRGMSKIALGVDADNPTGALRLYEKVGMRMERQYERWEKELRPGAARGL